MSLGGGASSSKSQSWYPGAKSFINQFIQPGESALGAAQDPDNPMTQNALNLLNQNVTGANLNPASDPALAPYISSLEQEANTNLGANLANIAGSANTGGMLLSSAANRNQAAAANTGQQNLSDTVSQLLQNQYNTGLANQQQSILPAIQQSDPAYARALELLQTFGGMGTSGSSSFNLSGSV